MKVKQLIRKLQCIKEELQNKEIYVVGINGLVFPPTIKFCLKDRCDPSGITKKNVEYIVIRD